MFEIFFGEATSQGHIWAQRHLTVKSPRTRKMLPLWLDLKFIYVQWFSDVFTAQNIERSKKSTSAVWWNKSHYSSCS